MKPTPFGRRLRELREGRTLSIYALAKASGVNQSNIAKMESGERDNPAWKTVAALAQALGVSTDVFRTEERKR